MPNGKIGDHPITDLMIHGRRVYSERADSLIRKIVELGAKEKIADLLLANYSQFDNLDVPELERVLTGMCDQLEAEARSRGWEVEE